MAFIKLQFRPGINREVTPYANQGGWYDCNNIRFRFGNPQQIGGWTRLTNTTFLGTCRSLHAWVTLTGNKYLGVGTDLKYYIYFNGSYYDITPIRLTATLTNPFTAVDGYDVITVTHTAHGASAREFVTFSGATGLGGNITAGVLNTEHIIESVIDANTYTIRVNAVATAADVAGSPGGGTVTAAYQIPNSGYPLFDGGDIWTSDNYGEDLLYNRRGGGIYYWDASAVNPLQQRGVALSSLPGATATPTIASQILVSDRDRHVIAFGCDDEFTPGVQDPMLIRFSSQESLTDWASTPTNTAGSLRLGSGSEIVTAVETRQQTLVFTDTTLYAMQFVGPPFTFGVNSISESITIASPNAACAVQDQVFWMGTDNFYVYNGAVSVLPCTVRDYVFSTLQRADINKVFSGVNAAFSEVWWFYPGLGSFSGDPDRYVIYNYAENIWYYGTGMRRGAWLDAGIFDYPIASTAVHVNFATNRLLEHEDGVNNGELSPAVAISSFIRSSVIELGDGYQYMFLSRVIPDVDWPQDFRGDSYVEIGLQMYDYPAGELFVQSGISGYSYQRYYDNEAGVLYQPELFYRLRGRSVSLVLKAELLNTAWRLGDTRIDVRTDGRK